MCLLIWLFQHLIITVSLFPTVFYLCSFSELVITERLQAAEVRRSISWLPGFETVPEGGAPMD